MEVVTKIQYVCIIALGGEKAIRTPGKICAKIMQILKLR